MKLHTLAFSVALSIQLTSHFLTADDAATKMRMHADLDVIRSTFQTQYAPVEWKGSYAGWDLDYEIENSKQRVNETSNITTKDYQHILKGFFDSVHDYHVSVTFYSTEAAELPFRIKSANGHTYFTTVDRARIGAFPIQVGDELLTFNNVPIAQAIKDFKDRELNRGDTLTDITFAEQFFSLRVGALGIRVPQGPVTISVKHLQNKKIKTYTVNWTYVPEQIKNIVPPALPKFAKGVRSAPPKAPVAKAANKLLFPLNQNAVFQKNMLSPYFAQLAKHDTIISADSLGSRESYVPTLGKKIWESNPDSQFYSYLFETPEGKRIGYVRIPHYTGEDEQVLQFKEIIEILEPNSEALIVDQVNNPGGSMFYMYSLASLLTDRPLTVPKHRISLTQKEIAFAVDTLPIFESITTIDEAKTVIGETFDGNPVTLKTVQQFMAYFQFILDEWSAGNTFTSPVYLWGMGEIDPYPSVHYTKPILVLINQMDISCGDFFPAILQDNKRARLFGTRTAGAGGFVLAMEYPNFFGIESFHYTGSIAQRVDDNPIENLGVKPDVEYTLTERDLTDNYRPYADAILKEVKMMIK